MITQEVSTQWETISVCLRTAPQIPPNCRHTLTHQKIKTVCTVSGKQTTKSVHTFRQWISKTPRTISGNETRQLCAQYPAIKNANCMRKLRQSKTHNVCTPSSNETPEVKACYHAIPVDTEWQPNAKNGCTISVYHTPKVEAKYPVIKQPRCLHTTLETYAETNRVNLDF